MKGGIAMPKCILKLVSHDSANPSLFAGIVDFFVNGEPVCHETRFIRNDAMTTRVYAQAISTGIVSLADGETFAVYDAASLRV